MKKIFLWNVLLLLCAGFLFGACEARKEEKKQLPPSKGLPYELLLVVDENLWNAPAGDSLRKDVVEAGMPGLPQNEPVFRLVRIFPKHFTQMYVTMRNILVVKENKSLHSVKMGIALDVEAAPQVYVCVETPDADALAEFLSRNAGRITSAFVESELAQEKLRLEKKYNVDVYKASQEIFGCGVKVPAEVGALKKGEDFLWASTDRVDQDMNYVCYALPLAAGKELTAVKWAEMRDSVMKRNIPGSTPRQWMATTRENGIPLVMVRTVQVDGHPMQEMRGLWEMHNGGIGGPFVSVAYPDSLHGRMLVAEGFIYSPRSPKREPVRRMEAAIRTLQVAEQ